MTIIADDLTGAADTGIAFAIAGLPTYVSLGARSARSARIVALDTDSRALPPIEAAGRAQAAARAAYRDGTRALYKKIDSTLRGNVGAEVAAVWQAASEAKGRAVAIVCPAFPRIGRTVHEGRVLVEGAPLDRTELWRRSGMTGPADLISILAAAGLTATIACANAPLPPDVAAVVCDAHSEEDLARIAKAGAELAVAVVWVGSAGLARHLPSALGLQGQGSAMIAAPTTGGPVLAMVGSLSSIAREQARSFAEEPGTKLVELGPDLLLAGDAALAETGGQVGRALATGTDVVLTIGRGTKIDLARGPALAAALGRFAAPFRDRAGGLIATGGDIARAALAAMGAGGLQLVGELEPGVPLGLTDMELPLRFVTKAGAFGSPSTLQRCRAALKARPG